MLTGSMATSVGHQVDDHLVGAPVAVVDVDAPLRSRPLEGVVDLGDRQGQVVALGAAFEDRRRGEAVAGREVERGLHRLGIGDLEVVEGRRRLVGDVEPHERVVLAEEELLDRPAHEPAGGRCS